MKIERIYIFAIFCLLSAVVGVGAQEKTAMSADQTLRSNARVNPSTLGMELSIPLAGYRGRGSNGVAVGLNYSSKVWRMAGIGDYPKGNTTECRSLSTPTFAEETASGWTSDLSVPFIEYTGRDNVYNDQGKPVNTLTFSCVYQGVPEIRVWVKRLTVHLPGGGKHELRADDSQVSYNITWQQSMGEQVQANWNTTFYSVDGSNLRYVEDSTTSTYRLYMPDGSTMDFSSSPSSIYTDVTMRSIRKAVKSTDTNGNFTTYHEPDVNHPNGYVTDTLGRTIDAPVGLEAPTAPTAPNQPQEYSVPGLSGNPLTYGLHWRMLEDALADPNADLCYRADGYPNPWEPDIPQGACTLFDFSNTYSVVAAPPSLGEFNPVVLSQIDLPSGQSYKFKYDIYGRIEKIEYPTGGTETFDYALVPVISAQGSPGADPAAEANFGVTQREVLESTGATPIEWTYAADRDDDWYKVTTTAPDETKSETYTKLGFNTPWCGFDSVLAGFPFEQNTYDSNDNLLAKTLTTYEVSNPGGKERHPRTVKVESIIYDPAASTALSSSATTSYATIDSIDDPLLPVSSSQYAFTTSLGSLGTLLRTTETDYVSDSNYTARNLRSLPAEVRVKDAAGNVRSKTQFAYDEVGTYPIISAGTDSQWVDPNTNYRGNVTTTRSWRDIANNLSIETHAQYDNFGNLRKAWDANGNLTQTDYSSTYAYAYPTSVTTPVPDTTGVHGSSTAFTTTATFDTVTGLPLTTTDANGLKTEITYDTVTLRPLNTKMYYGGVQVGGTSETAYHDEPGNFWVKNRSQIDGTNWAESITYFDGLGRAWKTEKADSGGNIFVEKEFDAEGRVKRVSNPFRSGETKQWTTNVYDEASRVVEVVLPDGATIETDYGLSTSGVVGITKQITDQAGKKRKGITDAQGRMVRVIEDPDGQNLNTDYVFDTLGNLRKTIQGEQSRYFMQDSLGRLLYAKQPEQEANTGFTATDPITGNTAWSVKYEYDNNGNITKTTDAEGVYIQGTYDAMNRITVRDYSDSTPDVGFYYDGKYLDASDTPQTATGSVKGKTTGVRSAVSKTNYPSFDVFGRPLSHQQITDGETYSTAYAYNLSGALIEETYPSGRVVRNDLDADGALSRVYGNAVSQTEQTYANSFNYDVNGAVTAMRLGNGKWETAQYNNRQQITQIGLGSGAGDTSLLKLEYGYGTSSQNNGSLREQTISFDGLADPFEQTYTYDDLNRLQVAEEKVDGTTTWKQTFEIDRYGNRRFDTSTSGLTTTLGSCTEAVCNPEISTATNRLTTSGYNYDKNGNLLQDAEGKQFVYDAENHQTEVKNDQSVTIGEYLYDGEGKRVKKISSTETTIFVYDASSQLVAEYSTELTTTPQVSYLTIDHLGSPRVVTDANGAVIDRKDYTAFGEVNYTAERTQGLGYDGSVEETRKGYTGYEKDNESGLDFAQARYYNSTHGRYTSVDPLTASATIRNPQTFNRYSYVLNSPYKFTDPLGLITQGLDKDNDGQVITKWQMVKEKWRREVLVGLGYAWAGRVVVDDTDDGGDESDKNRKIAAAAAPTDVVNLEQGGRIVAEDVEIKLPSQITSDLEDYAIEFSNLLDQLNNQMSDIRRQIGYLWEHDYDVSLSWTAGSVVIRDEGGASSGSWGFGGFGGSLTKEQRSNIADLANAYNNTVMKLRNRYTDAKTSFQTEFKNTRTVSTDGKWKRINITLSYLGRLFEDRLGSYGNR